MPSPPISTASLGGSSASSASGASDNGASEGCASEDDEDEDEEDEDGEDGEYYAAAKAAYRARLASSPPYAPSVRSRLGDAPPYSSATSSSSASSIVSITPSLLPPPIYSFFLNVERYVLELPI